MLYQTAVHRSSIHQFLFLLFFCIFLFIFVTLEDIFYGYRIPDWQSVFTFSNLKCLSTAFWPPFFLIRKVSILPGVMCHSSLSTFTIFYPSLLPSSLTVMHLFAVFFVFILPGIHWDTWIHELMSFNKFEKFLAIRS